MRVVVVGAGIVGLSIAWRAAQAGLAVSVVDPQPGSGASHAAAGMLIPVSEAHEGRDAFLALARASHRRWPAFADELARAGGIDLPLRAGSLVVGLDDEDLGFLARLARFQESKALTIELLDGDACRALEPALGPQVRGGLRADHEASVDSRRVCRALMHAVASAGAVLARQRAEELLVSAGRAVGVGLATGEVLDADRVVVAAGAWSPLLAGLPAEAVPPVRPVKGQILRLRPGAGAAPLRWNVRVVSSGTSAYVVPRDDGELVVGATVEEAGFDTATNPEAVAGLLAAAAAAVPSLAGLEPVEATAGLRPATPDGLPVVGPTPVPGLLLATGHHRSGVLLAPVTADAVVGHLTGGPVPAEAAGLGVERFHG